MHTNELKMFRILLAWLFYTFSDLKHFVFYFATNILFNGENLFAKL